MDEQSRKKWLEPNIYLPMGLILMGIFIYFYALSPQGLKKNSDTPPGVVNSKFAKGQEIQLPVNETRYIGRLHLTYKGLEAGYLLIDVILPELDKDSAYHRRISRETAEKGFKLGQSRFQVVSAEDRLLTLMPD